MHYLTLDTNTWIYLANGIEPVKLLNYIEKEVEKGNIVLLLPEIIVNEWNVNKDKAIRQGSLNHFREVEVSLERISKLLGERGERDLLDFLLEPITGEKVDYFEDIKEKFKKKKKDIETAVGDNIELIEKLFKHPTTVIITVEDKIYKKAGQFALEKKAPFKNKNSFADALIIFSLLDYVASKKIEGSYFISYNSEDFCEKKDGKKFLHPDLVDEFKAGNCLYYHIVAEAIKTIEKDIVTDEELEIIRAMQDDIEYCRVCDGNSNEVYFRNFENVQDERTSILNYSNDQLELGFSQDLPKARISKKKDEIETGCCNYCNTAHYKCVDCEAVNAVWDGEYNKLNECEGCGLKYLIKRWYDRDGLENIEYIIPETKITCEKCGEEFRPDFMMENLCGRCENEYSYEG